MKKKSFLYGALILTASALISKVLGALYRIPLTNLLGTEGVGLYQMIFPVYALLLVLSSSGIPVAISRLISEEVALDNKHNVNRILKSALGLMMIIGLSCSALIFFSGSFVANLQGNSLASIGYLAVAPSILISSLVAAFRGYFEGLQNMKPTAISEIIEQITKVAMGLFLANLLLPRGVEYGVLGAVLGIAISELVSLTIIIFLYFITKRKDILENKVKQNTQENQATKSSISEKDSYLQVCKTIFKKSIPITMGAIIIPITVFIDSILIINLLVGSGFNISIATSLFGIQTGVVNSLINVPMIIAIAVATAILPTISASRTLKKPEEIREKSVLAIKIVWLVALPCFVGFMLLAPDITEFLYAKGLNSGQVSEMQVAGSLIRIAAISIVYTSMLRVLIALLHAMDKSYLAVKNLIIASLIKIVITLILVSTKEVNIYGASLASAISYGMASLFSLMSVRKLTPLKFDFVEFVVNPLIASSVLIGVIFLTKIVTSTFLAERLVTVAQILAGGLFYFITIAYLKVFNENELKYIPALDKIKEKFFRRRAKNK